MSKNYCKIGKIWCKECSRNGCKYGLIQPSLSNIRSLNTLNTCPKRNNERTISFNELLTNSSFDDVMDAMHVHHADEKENIDGYKNAFHILNGLKPIKPSFNMYICLNTVIDKFSEEHTEYIDVYGFIRGRNVKYAIDLMDWHNILYLNIHPDTLKIFDKNIIVAEILWEITFHGYSPTDINLFSTRLKDSFEKMRIEYFDKKHNGK